MRKIAVAILFLVFLMPVYGQKLVYKDNGKIMDQQGQKLSPKEVRELYAGDYKILDLYNEGRTKKRSAMFC